MMRFERKYRIEQASYEEVYHEVMNMFGAFDTAYPDRWINSIYLDSIDFNALRDNLSGISQRNKYRLRWYGDDFEVINSPVLEEKIKHNMLGYKKYLNIEDTILMPQALEKALNITTIRDNNLFPVVLVRYLRTYFESFDRRVRITIDRKLSYRGVNNYILDPSPNYDDAIVLEIKYDKNIENEIDDILQSVKFRLTKNSKFVNAMMDFWD